MTNMRFGQEEMHQVGDDLWKSLREEEESNKEDESQMMRMVPVPRIG